MYVGRNPRIFHAGIRRGGDAGPLDVERHSISGAHDVRGLPPAGGVPGASAVGPGVDRWRWRERRVLSGAAALLPARASPVPAPLLEAHEEPPCLRSATCWTTA